jgi:hypothetical protein
VTAATPPRASSSRCADAAYNLEFDNQIDTTRQSKKGRKERKESKGETEKVKRVLGF